MIPRNMKRTEKVRHVLFFCLALVLTMFVLTSWGYAQTSKTGPTVRIAASPTRVYAGESFRFQIHLDNFDKPEQPDTKYLESEFRVQYQGEQNRNSTQIVIIRGNQKRIEEHGITYNYVLTPLNSGRIQIEPPQVSGGTFAGKPITIEVIEPSEQENVLMELSSSATSVYPLIPFDITLSIFVRELPGKYAKYDPIKAVSAEIGPPALEIPWLVDEQLPNGLSPTKSWQDWITGYRNNRGGFEVNNIRTEDPFDIGFSFFEQRRSSTVFLPAGEIVERSLKDGTKARYWQYKFTRTFTGQTPGEMIFDAATIKGTFIEAQGEKLETADLYTLSPPLTVTIREVPEKGRPDNYIGAFGMFTWTSSLLPEKAHVGEAMTLTLSLDGKGSLLNIKQPDLERIPEIAEHFKIYPPTEEIGDENAKFIWSLRPLQEGNIVFPAIPISFFDTEKEQFVQVATEPISITVEKSNVLTTPVGSEAALKMPQGSTSLTRSEGGIYANRTDARMAVDQRFTMTQWLRDLAIIIGITALTGFFLLFARSERFSSFCRRNDRFKESRRQYEQGMALLSASDMNEMSTAGSALKNAFLLPVAEWFTRPVETLTENDATRLIESLNLPDALMQKTQWLNFFKELEQLRYGMDRQLTDRLRTSAVSLFEQWYAIVSQKRYRKVIKMTIQTMEKKRFPVRGNGFGGSLLLLISIFILGAMGCQRSAGPLEQDSFREALRLFDEAQTVKTDSEPASIEKSQELFRKSAAVYEGLLERGRVSGPILYNQGNAWWHAGESAKALACWRQAQQFMPRDPYLKANLAMMGAPATFGGTHFHWENILFWQNWISSPAKFRLSLLFAILTAVSLMALWLVPNRHQEEQNEEASDTRNNFSRILSQLAIAFAVLFVVMTVSALYDWNRFDRLGHGIVSAEETIARKGNSVSYEPAFSQPLPKLSEITILGREGDWLRTRATDGQDCWIAASDVIVY